jgi:hypothetical protein
MALRLVQFLAITLTALALVPSGAHHAALPNNYKIARTLSSVSCSVGFGKTSVGSVLPLDQAQTAHGMLGGVPHERGKIVLKVAD